MNTDLPISIKLPEKFLEQEVRCDFVVTIERKRVWAILLDELCAFKSICERHNLKWYMAAGSLLGTIRHGGFIPWDDDLDVSMPRADFDLFCKIAPRELPKNLFLQTSFSDPYYACAFAKLRNSRTCAVERPIVERKWRCNQGIGMDIFPMDGIPRSDSRKKWLQIILDILYRTHCRSVSCYSGHSLRSIILSSGSKVIYGLFGVFILKFREFLLRCSDETNSEECCLFCGEKSFMRKFKWSYALFKANELMKFEGVDVRVPSRSDECLSLSYGDWHKFVHDSSFHVDIVQKLYPDRDFPTVLINDYGYRKKWLKKWLKNEMQ